MPIYSIEIIEFYPEKLNTLDIQLEPDEEISDSLLSTIDIKIQSVSFRYRSGIGSNFALNTPLKITCSSDGLERLNLKALMFMGVVDGIDDKIFAKCSNLEYLWLGASLEPVLDSAPNLINIPLKKLRLNGYGVVRPGKDLEKIMKNIEFEMYI